jgi:putative restriction endonuclease
MGQDPEAADNGWLREAFKNQVPIIYFLGIALGRAPARSVFMLDLEL